MEFPVSAPCQSFWLITQEYKSKQTQFIYTSIHGNGNLGNRWHSSQHHSIECVQWIGGQEASCKSVDGILAALLLHCLCQHQSMPPERLATCILQSILSNWEVTVCERMVMCLTFFLPASISFLNWWTTEVWSSVLCLDTANKSGDVSLQRIKRSEMSFGTTTYRVAKRVSFVSMSPLLQL